MDYDVIIIGAGAVGSACARELSRYDLKIAVLEKGCDVAGGTSGRNSAVVHAGFNNKTGSLMASLCVEGNRGFEEICRTLDVPYKKTGKLLVALCEEDVETLKGLRAQGEANGCEGLRLIGEEELRRIAPGVQGIGAMLSPDTAIVNPFLYTIALAENAANNGADFFFRQELSAAKRCGDSILLTTTDGTQYRTRVVVNSAGLSSAAVSDMFGVRGYRLYPCRGQYLILDKNTQKLAEMPIYPAPKKGSGGLGVHITPTTDGNLILGPSNEYIEDGEDCGTTGDVLDRLIAEAREFLPALKRSDIIGQYAGIRAKQAPETEGGFRDFVIREEETFPGLINLIGIESPGLTASVPIARTVAKLLDAKFPLTEKTDFRAERKGPVRFRELSEEEKEECIRKNPNYGEIVCRCEQVTKQEVIDAIENPLHTVTLSGIKNRTRCMTGRCQGGYCLARIAEILIHDYGYRPEDILLKETDSNVFAGTIK